MEKAPETNIETVEKTTKIETVYKRPDNRKEIIELDFEKELIDFIDFYKKTNIDLPPDFEETMRDIWYKNQKQIQSEIESKGFNQILLIPGNISLTELTKKMNVVDVDLIGISERDLLLTISQNSKDNRIIITYGDQELTDRPELKQTLSTKGEKIDLQKILSLEDYLILQRKYFEETGKHLDEEKRIWLSTEYDSYYLITSDWDRMHNRLRICETNRIRSFYDSGVRPSSTFK